MSAEVAEVLERAADRIAGPNRWVKKIYAANTALNTVCHPCAVGASCWCAVGALVVESSTYPDKVYEKARAALTRLMPPNMSIFDWNDAPDTKQEDVVAKFRVAAAAERMKQD